MIRWSGEEVELHNGFFDDGRITFYDEFTNIQIKLDKLTGILTERRLYPRTSSNDLFYNDVSMQKDHLKTTLVNIQITYLDESTN